MPNELNISDKSVIVFDEQHNNLLHETISTYGLESQHMMMIEEMAELSLAICKVRRMLADNIPMSEIYKYVENHLIQEIVDVRIMIEQMVLIYVGDTFVFDYKMNRLKQRLDEVKRNTEHS